MKMMMNGRPNFDSLFYDTRVEIFMALRDVSFATKTSRKVDLGFTATPKSNNQQIISYWKPPGSDQWLERCRTEVLPGKLARFLQFVTKVYLDVEAKDATSTLLKFDIGHADLITTLGNSSDLSRWSTAEISLDKLLLAGATGIELVLPLILDPCTKEWEGAEGSKMIPGILFLRAEVLQKPAVGIAIQFGIEAEHPATCGDYYIEFYKLNEECNFDIPNPYTLIYRSDLGKVLDDSLSQFCGKPQYFLESRVANGNPERVLKIEVYKKISHTKKGFVLTTLGNMINEGFQAIPVDRVDPNPKLSFCQTTKSMSVIVKLAKEIQLKRLHYYFNMGLKFLRIYAVDYSRSNWDLALHKSVLHDSRFNPYEDALEMLAKINSDISYGDSIFYSFGNTKDSYFGTFPEDNHLNSLIASYRAALCSEKMAALEINDTETVSTVSSEGDESGSCVPLIYRPIPVNTKTHLAPLLDEISTLLSTRASVLEYYTIYILTDGQIFDIDKVLESINELSKQPISIIFIGIGLGCFESLRYLENVGNIKPAQGKYRKCIRVIHFRSSFNWSTSIMFHKMCVHPLDIFRKEILTAVRDQALAFYRIYFPEL